MDGLGLESREHQHSSIKEVQLLPCLGYCTLNDPSQFSYFFMLNLAPMIKDLQNLHKVLVVGQQLLIVLIGRLMCAAKDVTSHP